MPPKLGRIPGWTRNREELAWAAGFLDGEGSFYLQRIGVRKNGNPANARPRFEIGQIHKQPLERFRRAVGFAAPVNGPYNNKTHAGSKAKPIYQFSVSGFTDIEMLLNLLRPWLGRIKRTQALRVLKEAREQNGRSKAE